MERTCVLIVRHQQWLHDMTGWILICITLVRVGALFEITEQETPQPSKVICEQVAANWVLRQKMSGYKVEGGYVTYSTRCEYRR